MNLPIPDYLAPRLKHLATTRNTEAIWQTIHKGRKWERWELFGPLSDAYGDAGDEVSHYFCSLVCEGRLRPFGGCKSLFAEGPAADYYDRTYFRSWHWYEHDMRTPNKIMDMILWERAIEDTGPLADIYMPTGFVPSDFVGSCMPTQVKDLEDAFTKGYYKYNVDLRPMPNGVSSRPNKKILWKRGFQTQGLAYEALLIAYHLAIHK